MNNESNIGGISVRAILVLMLITVFSISIFFKINSESLNSVVMAVVGWYFGQKSTTPPTPPAPPAPPTPVGVGNFCPTCGKSA